MSLWNQTYLCSNPHGDTRHPISVCTAINEHGCPHLVSNIGIDLRDSGCRCGASVDLSVADMRALARLLDHHADRIDNYLTPLLHQALQTLDNPLERITA